MVICNNCGTEMRDFVVCDSGYRECHIHIAYEPNPKDYWLYICPKCGNVQANIADEDNEE